MAAQGHFLSCCNFTHYMVLSEHAIHLNEGMTEPPTRTVMSAHEFNSHKPTSVFNTKECNDPPICCTETPEQLLQASHRAEYSNTAEQCH